LYLLLLQVAGHLQLSLPEVVARQAVAAAAAGATAIGPAAARAVVRCCCNVVQGFNTKEYKANADFILDLSARLTDAQKMTAEFYGQYTLCACACVCCVAMLLLSVGAASC
jgi:hypothetical protein